MVCDLTYNWFLIHPKTIKLFHLNWGFVSFEEKKKKCQIITITILHDCFVSLFVFRKLKQKYILLVECARRHSIWFRLIIIITHIYTYTNKERQEDEKKIMLKPAFNTRLCV